MKMETTVRIPSKRKWRQKKLTKTAVNNEFLRLRRESILNVLEIIDFKITSEVEDIRKVLPVLQDYVDRGEELLQEGKRRELIHETECACLV